MGGRIHPSAVIDPGAELDSTVQVGPGAVIGFKVRIGAETVIDAHALIESNTTIGKRNRFFPFAAIGLATPDLKFHGEPSTLEIGDANTFREFTSIHRGTEAGGMVTRIGNHTLVMPYVHIAHDCQVGDHCVLVNSTQLAGHCVIDEWVNIEGMCGVHQFCHVGAHSFLAAGAKAAQDVPPYTMVAGDRARLVGINVIGLQRRGFSAETIAALKAAVRTLFYSRLLREDAIAQVREQHGGVPEVRRMVDFIAASERGVVGRARE
ncbi:MAG: acyl-ACP--UDP-N-acetylglucosamine O-acyltransferase [Candidatus Binataceae bacterium]